jgi:hypothetical protein
MKIFISYGHDEYAPIVKRIIESLKKLNYDCWVDFEQLKQGKDWENMIENGINQSDWIILFMTDHSMRRPDGYCLSEISYSQQLNKKIFPIKINEVIRPISIVRLQYLNLEDLILHPQDENLYQQKIAQIHDVLVNQKELESNDEESLKNDLLIKELQPLDNETVIREHRNNFKGREWLFNDFENWINDPDRNIYVLLGEAGSGKTTFVSNLIEKYSCIKAAHFCQINNSARSNPKRILCSLAYHLATQIPIYKEELLKYTNLNAINDMNSVRLFEYLFIEPLSKIKIDETCVIVIDAIDEAISPSSKNEILNLLINDFSKLPIFIKFFITSRPNKDILTKSSKFQTTNIESSQNRNDIECFIIDVLNKNDIKFNSSTLDKLLNITKGNFLFANIVLNDIISNNLSLENLDDYPPCLNDFYYCEFKRIVDFNCYDYHEISKFFKVLVGEYEPVNTSLHEKICNFDDDLFDEICEKFVFFLKKENNCIIFKHKSIHDFLLDESYSKEFYLEESKCHRFLANIFQSLYNNGTKVSYIYLFLIKHYLGAEKFLDAETLITNEQFMLQRKEVLNKEDFITSYVEEIAKICSESNDLLINKDIVQSPTFISIMNENKDFLIRSGLLIKLKALFTSNVLDALKNSELANIKILCLNYLYLSENYNEAIIYGESINKARTLGDAPKIELDIYDALSLIYRKLSIYDKYYQISKSMYELSEECGDKENRAKAAQKLGRYYYIVQDFGKMKEYYDAAMDYFVVEANKSKDIFDIKQDQLHFACYAHEAALFFLYEFDVENAKIYLDKAKKVYDSYQNTKDRFYGRWCYVNMFYNIVVNNDIEVRKWFNLALSNANNKYKLCLSEYFITYHFAFNLKNKEEAKKHINKALEYLEGVDAVIEKEEVLLLDKFIDLNGNVCSNDLCDKDKYIDNWKRYMFQYMKKFSGRN